MKNFEFLFCFLLCVLPCVFTDTISAEERMSRVAKTLEITQKDLQECLNKVDTDLGTMLNISDMALNEPTRQTQDTITKVSCFGACVFKKNGMMNNSKIVTERFIELLSGAIQIQEHLALVRTQATECNKRVSSKTDECDIAFTFSTCFVQQISREN